MEDKTPKDRKLESLVLEDEGENAEIAVFQVKECYVYKIPPRRSAASYRADEWNINKWEWEGCLKVVSKGSECTIRLEDSSTGELFAQAPVKEDQPLPLEAVIDSSRFFVLRIEDNSSSGSSRHAFIGIGFRERNHAYDFQAALHDHLNFLNKKQAAEEMAQEYESKPSADYSLQDGQILHLKINSSGLGKKDVQIPPSPSTPGSIPMPFPKPSQKQSKSNSPIPSIIPPPPPDCATNSTPPQKKRLDLAPNNDSNFEEDFGDFGDFVTAT